jgi:ATP-dependent DNA helicase RecG
VQGEARRRGPGLQLANPKFEVLDDAAPAPDESAEESYRPVYPASGEINSRQIQEIIARILEPAIAGIDDHLSDDYRKERNLPELREAYRMMHAPEDEDEFLRARRRLAYDELLLLQLGLQIKRAQLRRSMTSPALKFNQGIDTHIRERIPFTLTPAQDHVVEQVARDLASSIPTNRLIQGDVGSGKTVVALYAMLMAVASNAQAALMAPTELLAEQHFASISQMLTGSRVRLALLTGATPEAERTATLARIEAGEIDIVIGTHALLSGRVAFANLAVAIIDEQHRFGVHQRASLRSKGAGVVEAEEADPSTPGKPVTPHVLVMTATPIPRTIAISLLGDLDVSTIDALPPGRKPVVTRVVTPDQRGDVYTWLRERLDDGDQAYVVVPTIDTGGAESSPTSVSGLRDLRSVQKRLEERELAGLRIAAMHGRLKRATREHIMERFRSGVIDCLIATTVIEVGVDVPNASVMIIEHAERFGLAQLHQLRGRVGRGERASVCVLIGEPTTPDAQRRLEAIGATSDGFILAEKDIEIRGPGEVFGTRQSGAAPLKVADLARDLQLLRMARKDAEAWIERSPDLDGPDDALIKRRLMKAHGETLMLGDVG